MYITELDNGRLYGKTGSGTGKAWFVGFIEENDRKIYFAVYLEDMQGMVIYLQTSKQILIEL